MDYKKTATDILNYVGGENNVSHLEHCSTRLRFTLAEDNKVNMEALKKVHGVLGVVMAAQCQVIVGNNVIEVYDELLKIGKFGGQNNNNTAAGNKKIGAVVLDFIVSIFQPLVPAIAGAGILKSLLLVLTMFKIVNKADQTYVILGYISDTVFYFLPIMVAITTATKMKVNKLVAVAAMGTLLFPNMTALIGKGASFLSMPITNVAYASQVFPAILGVLFYAYMERLFTKISPKPIRIFFVPMMSLLLTVPMTLLLLGPIGFKFGTLLTAAILFVFSKFGWIAVGLLAAILPFMIATGMHKALVPYAISSITGMKKELLYLPASLAHNISESGACFAVALRTKNTELKSTAISAGISALFGITEPALYAVTLQRKRVLTSVVLSSLIGGLCIGLFGVAAFTAVGPGIASITMFIDEKNSKNLTFAIAGFAISFVASFIITFISWKEDKNQDEDLSNNEAKNIAETTNTNINLNSSVDLKQPIKGEIISLAEVKDDVFSKKILGEGIAIKPLDGNLYAPCDGEVVMLFDTKHTLALRANNGAELLFHIGIDTVQLNGKHFEPKVKVGDIVKTGELLMKFDLKEIKAAGYDTVIPIIITNSDQYLVEKNSYSEDKDIIMKVSKLEV
ncbi:beta-glucoside-specific PTS transporter subunit IIABC [Clostridium scatologenes]|uniref:PTS system beta-glucoside-specific transporter subunit IIBCA n=1 Tax=Clostridium scatologenes TaxID=1548 RepID=A0A0E3JY47_CLOSL|nr:beta-glucoside-specific PTS transporter subunit IIABC [Clostridium scatologenes]AKA67220.1 PTS system beta-glucoside-specific transporter subunit IIBCA [Clostridium scatologenes]